MVHLCRPIPRKMADSPGPVESIAVPTKRTRALNCSLGLHNNAVSQYIWGAGGPYAGYLRVFWETAIERLLSS